MQMNVQELQSLRTGGANVLIVVLANGGYLSIRQTHENFFGAVVGASPASGVDVPDFARLAAAYGIESARVSSVDEVALLDQFLGRDGPLLLHVDVDPAQGFEPRVKSRMLPDGRFATPELDDMYPFLPPEEVAAIRAEASALRARPPK